MPYGIACARSHTAIELQLRIDRDLDSVMADAGMQRLKPYLDDGTIVITQVRCEDMFDWSGVIEDKMLTGRMKIRRPVLPAQRMPCNRLLHDFNVAVLPDGAVRLCYCGRGTSNYGPLIIGSILESPLDSMRLNAAHRALIRDWMEDRLPEECRGCSIWQPNPCPPARTLRLVARLLTTPAFWRRRLSSTLSSGGNA